MTVDTRGPQTPGWAWELKVAGVYSRDRISSQILVHANYNLLQ